MLQGFCWHLTVRVPVSVHAVGIRGAGCRVVDAGRRYDAHWLACDTHTHSTSDIVALKTKLYGFCMYYWESVGIWWKGEGTMDRKTENKTLPKLPSLLHQIADQITDQITPAGTVTKRKNQIENMWVKQVCFFSKRSLPVTTVGSPCRPHAFSHTFWPSHLRSLRTISSSACSPYSFQLIKLSLILLAVSLLSRGLRTQPTCILSPFEDRGDLVALCGVALGSDGSCTHSHRALIGLDPAQKGCGRAGAVCHLCIGVVRLYMEI